MPGIKKYNQLKIFAHTVFWLISICLILFLFYYNENKIYFSFPVISKAIIINLGFALSVYINLYILIPRFLKLKKYIFYVFWLVLLLTLASLIIQLLLIFPFNIHTGKSFHSFNPDLHAACFFASLIYIAVTTFLKFISDWIAIHDLNLKMAKIEQQKIEAELKSLKSQLNPHFLFNSLNNIYSLALIKSEKVPELILTLADLMRHIIYESRENFIDLDKEIAFVNNFIALQKIRVSEQVQIDYEIKGNIPPAKLAPLLFEPFIDNSFKHGLPYNNEKDHIYMSFDFTVPGWLTFLVENNYETMDDASKKISGIGIMNVKERLRYLYDPSEYELNISHQDYIHSVSLSLKLR